MGVGVSGEFCGIVSGGQTGADRGGIDAAIEMGVSYCGWCPKGRRAEDGTIPEYIKLTESNSADYALRTEINVAFAAGVLVFTHGQLTGGSQLTHAIAMRLGRPRCWIDLSVPGEYAAALAQFVTDRNITYLMVAGNRESKAPGIYQAVRTIMVQVLARLT
jgi:hypothetical protein